MTFADDIPSAVKEYIAEHAEEDDFHVQVNPYYKPASTICAGYKVLILWHDPIVDDHRKVGLVDISHGASTKSVLNDAREVLNEAEETIQGYRQAAVKKGL